MDDLSFRLGDHCRYPATEQSCHMDGNLKIFGFIAIGFVAVFIAASTILPILTKVESAESLQSVAWLPPSATNVSYAKNYNRRYFEFDISEIEFTKWAREYSLAEISNPIDVTRYTIMIDDLGALTADIQGNPRYTAVISNGLTDSHTQSNHGGYTVVFDRDRGRAYFESARR